MLLPVENAHDKKRNSIFIREFDSAKVRVKEAPLRKIHPVNKSL